MICFIQDNDCHWYKIPVSLRDRFQELLENEQHDEIDAEFTKYRSMHPCNYMFKSVQVLKEH